MTSRPDQESVLYLPIRLQVPKKGYCKPLSFKEFCDTPILWQQESKDTFLLFLSSLSMVRPILNSRVVTVILTQLRGHTRQPAPGTPTFVAFGTSVSRRADALVAIDLIHTSSPEGTRRRLTFIDV